MELCVAEQLELVHVGSAAALFVANSPAKVNMTPDDPDNTVKAELDGLSAEFVPMPSGTMNAVTFEGVGHDRYPLHSHAGRSKMSAMACDRERPGLSLYDRQEHREPDPALNRTRRRAAGVWRTPMARGG
jgi:hypothetical protein